MINIYINEFRIDSIIKCDSNTFTVHVNLIQNQLIIYNYNSNYPQDVCYYKNKDIWSLNISLRKDDGFIIQ